MQKHMLYSAVLLTCVSTQLQAQVYYESVRVLPPAGSAEETFGFSIDMSNSMILVGSEFANNAGETSGAAYLYNPNTGALIRELISPDVETGDAFGSDVAIEGTLALVGARLDEGAGGRQGRAYLFNTNTGAQLRRFSASDGGPLHNFGTSVAMHNGVIAIGAPVSQNLDGSLGGVYVYLVSTPTDNEIVRLGPDLFSGDERFGISVDVNDDYIAVGASGADPLLADEAVYVFDIVTGARLRRLSPTNPIPGELFGRSVALAGDFVVVGAPNSGSVPSNSGGSVYIFNILDGSQFARIHPDEIGSFDEFGFSVATNGQLIVVGAPGDDDEGGNAGAVYVINGINMEVIDKVTPVQTNTLDDFGFSVAMASPRIVAGAPALGDTNGAFYIMNPFCDADLNADGVVNFFDVSTFIKFLPDFNGDGVFNFFDVSEFLNAYNSGCSI